MIVQFCNNMGTRPLALVGGTCCVDVDGCDSGSVSVCECSGPERQRRGWGCDQVPDQLRPVPPLAGQHTDSRSRCACGRKSENI